MDFSKLSDEDLQQTVRMLDMFGDNPLGNSIAESQLKRAASRADSTYAQRGAMIGGFAGPIGAGVGAQIGHLGKMVKSGDYSVESFSGLATEGIKAAGLNAIGGKLTDKVIMPAGRYVVNNIAPIMKGFNNVGKKAARDVFEDPLIYLEAVLRKVPGVQSYMDKQSNVYNQYLAANGIKGIREGLKEAPSGSAERVLHRSNDAAYLLAKNKGIRGRYSAGEKEELVQGYQALNKALKKKENREFEAISGSLVDKKTVVGEVLESKRGPLPGFGEANASLSRGYSGNQLSRVLPRNKQGEPSLGKFFNPVAGIGGAGGMAGLGYLAGGPLGAALLPPLIGAPLTLPILYGAGLAGAGMGAKSSPIWSQKADILLDAFAGPYIDHSKTPSNRERIGNKF